MYYLDMDVRVWYKSLPHGSISSLKRFHIAYNDFYKILYPPTSLFKYYCEYFNVENISKTNDVVEDICGDQLQENIYLYQEALPNNQEKEVDFINLPIKPRRSYSIDFDGYPIYDLYESDGELGATEPQQSQSWEATQKEEVDNGINKEASIYDLHPSYGEQGISICLRQLEEENYSHKIKTTSSSEYISTTAN